MMSIKVSSIEWLVKVVKHEAGELGDAMLYKFRTTCFRNAK